MRLGKLVAQVVTAPVKAVVAVPEVLADVADELGKTLSGDKK